MGGKLTVKNLIVQLEALPPDLPVLLQKDPEGNGYHWLGGSEVGSVEDLNEHHVDHCGIAELTAQAAKEGYADEDVLSHKVCVIYP